MAHSKLYRNFIILQEDERGYSSSNDKALSGYAKVEAKGDKCKVSFYAQNLKQDGRYSMVLICCKKDFKQLIDLGPLEVNDVGKGDTSKEYYVNNIAGMGISYDKISGAAICKINTGDITVIMHGFMNGEEATDNWRKYKIVKADSNKIEDKQRFNNAIDTSVNTVKKNDIKKEKIIDVEPTKAEPIKAKSIEVKQLEPKVIKSEEIETEKENITKNRVNTRIPDIEVDTDTSTEDRHKKKCDDKEKSIDDHIKEIYDKLDTYECDISLNIKDLKNDIVVYGFIKNKKGEKCTWKKFKIEKSCKREELSIPQNSRRLEENINLDKIDFEKYEKSISNINSTDDFEIKGSTGKYFESIAKGFEPYREKLEDINYCKWYKINVNSMDDLCNKSNYNQYTLAYYPMINYYPYISKEKYFLIGYKCDSSGELQHIVYAIPGSKDRSDQPYGGKTGFVTWTRDNTRGNGYWLMFYDYKKCSIVVPIK
ncbi:hypothetical protein [Clostridium sp. SM-530-WT-3G]|uniref:hypothetical protein n=1 Tax=Clostridium sp. SM-530-WT-3G TaxID=2725303 RepID=UPI00145E21CB|nr:hypothetical protein [Clostridium sp. SM-530-WT-3G]NME82320.1 hypothetical protein [Clostridium sp. SM-530-WT-3G]